MNGDAGEPAAGSVPQQLGELALSRGPTLGSSRLVCIDGPAGSGKTTLGNALRDSLAERAATRLLHMDDFYEGWSGLGKVASRIEQELVVPLRHDRPGRYHRYDWHAERFAEEHVVEPADVVILEGVGSGARSYAPHITVLVWVEAPHEVRLARGVERDGEELLRHWLAWMQDEAAVFAREDTRDRADVIVDGTDGTSMLLR